MKKFLSTLLSAAMFVSVAGIPTFADEMNIAESVNYNEQVVNDGTLEQEDRYVELMSTETSGACGDNLTWTLDDEGTLTISGTGDMWDSEDVNNQWHIWPEYGKDIKKVVINNGITSIGIGAFSFCGNIESVEIPDSIISIGNSAFNFCTNLETIEIPKSVKFIGRSAFRYAPLKSVRIPENVTVLGDYAFEFCDNLTTVYIENGLEKIGVGTFMYCNISTVFLPKSVKTVESCAFRYCPYIKDIYYTGSETDWDNINNVDSHPYTDLTKDKVHFNSTGTTPPTITGAVCSMAGTTPQISVSLADTEYDSTMITAFYKDGVLVDIQTTLVSANDAEKTVPVTNTDADTAKVMIWSSLDRMKPLCEAKSVNLNEGEL